MEIHMNTTDNLEQFLPILRTASIFSRVLCRVIGWRTLLLRREQIVAMEEKRPVRRLFPFDYLIGIDDFSRMGAFYCRNDFPFGTKLG